MTTSCSTSLPGLESIKIDTTKVQFIGSAIVDLVGLIFGTFGTLEVYLHDAADTVVWSWNILASSVLSSVRFSLSVC